MWWEDGWSVSEEMAIVEGEIPFFKYEPIGHDELAAFCEQMWAIREGLA